MSGIAIAACGFTNLMPVYRLSKDLVFPPTRLAEPGGLLAVGGDLSPERLLLAYKCGIFPWYSDEDPILWWAPDPRLVLYLDDLRISKSLARTIRKGKFQVRFDTVFRAVISACARDRFKRNEGTWITDDMMAAYIRLHELGYAHCVECWMGNELVGGLYGVSIGKAFFGESMFSKVSDASKVALVHLRDFLQINSFDFIDCQLPTKHLIGLGAVEVSRVKFQAQLKISVGFPSMVGAWNHN